MSHQLSATLYKFAAPKGRIQSAVDGAWNNTFKPLGENIQRGAQGTFNALAGGNKLLTYPADAVSSAVGGSARGLGEAARDSGYQLGATLQGGVDGFNQGGAEAKQRAVANAQQLQGGVRDVGSVGAWAAMNHPYIMPYRAGQGARQGASDYDAASAPAPEPAPDTSVSYTPSAPASTPSYAPPTQMPRPVSLPTPPPGAYAPSSTPAKPSPSSFPVGPPAPGISPPSFHRPSFSRPPAAFTSR